MKKLFLLLCSLVLFFAPLAAEPDDEYEESETITFSKGMTFAGDHYIKIGLNLNIPMNFPDFVSLFDEDKHQLYFGGFGTLGYHHFLTNHFAIGLDVGFGFNVTIASHMFNYVPVVFTATYEPSIGAFEFPLTIGIGFAWETYNHENYFPGLVINPQIGAHYRISSNWSAGLEFSYMLLPQFNSWYHEDSRDWYGHFINVGLVARYIF